MDVPPTRRRQHRQPLSRSASEPASKLSVSAGGPGTGAGRNAPQLSASLPASFAQNNDHRSFLADSLNSEEEVKEHLLGRFPRCRPLHRNVGTCRMSVLSALIAAAAMTLWLGGTSVVVFIAVRTTHVHVHESNSDTDGDGTIPTSRRVSIHNISKPLNLETDEETDARILEEDRRNDHHQRRKRLFANPVQRDKMIEELKKVKALLEKQQTSQSPLRGQRKNAREKIVT